VLSSANAGAQRSDFELCRWRADQVALGINWISAGWNVQDQDHSSPTPGYGNSLIAPAVAYPGGNDAPHVTGVEHLVEGSAMPIDPLTFAPLAGGPLPHAAQPLPAEIPADLRPTYEIHPDLTHATLTIEPRASLTTLGAMQ